MDSALIRRLELSELIRRSLTAEDMHRIESQRRCCAICQATDVYGQIPFYAIRRLSTDTNWFEAISSICLSAVSLVLGGIGILRTSFVEEYDVRAVDVAFCQSCFEEYTFMHDKSVIRHYRLLSRLQELGWKILNKREFTRRFRTQ